MWFTDVASVDNPGKEELRLFIQDVRHFLFFILEDTQNFTFLWQHDPSLYDIAVETMKHDIAQGKGLELDKFIANIDDRHLEATDLHGRTLRFRFQVLNSIASQWKSTHRDFSVRVWFKQVMDAIDTILDPLVEVAGGTGRQIKNFKDTLASLA
jgi:hypothetical protein